MKRLTLAVCLAFIATTGINAGVARADSHEDGALTCRASVMVGDSSVDLQHSYDSSNAIQIDLESPISFSASVSEKVDSHIVGVDLVVRQIDIDIDIRDLGTNNISWNYDIPASASNIGEIAPGLYNVYWIAKTAGGEECKVDGLFEIEGSVFSDPIGIVATATLLLGGVGLVLTVGKDATATLALTIRVTIGGKVKKGDEPGWYQWLKPRADWSFSLTLLSTLIGLLFGVGNAVFLQQAAIAPLSVELALQVVLPSVLLPPALSSLKILDHVLHQR